MTLGQRIQTHRTRLGLSQEGLEEQVAALQSQAEEPDPAELVADWGFKVISFSSAGRTVEFQVLPPGMTPRRNWRSSS